MQSQRKTGSGPTPAAEDKMFCLTPPPGEDPDVSSALAATLPAAEPPPATFLTAFTDGTGTTPLLSTPVFEFAATAWRLIKRSGEGFEEGTGDCVGSASTETI